MGGPQPVTVSGATYLKIGNQADGGYNPWGPWNPEEMDVDDFAVALIRCDSGATLSLECSWALNIIDDEYYRIWVAGDRAGAEVILGRNEESATRLRVLTAESDSWVDRVHQNFPPVPWPHHAAIADFVRAVREGGQPGPPATTDSASSKSSTLSTPQPSLVERSGSPSRRYRS